MPALPTPVDPALRRALCVAAFWRRLAWPGFDTALLVMGLHRDFNLRRLERST